MESLEIGSDGSFRSIAHGEIADIFMGGIGTVREFRGAARAAGF